MGEPLEIADGDDLCRIGDDPERDCVLVDDVDVSDVENLCVLDTEFNRFDGTLDGNGHAIEGVTVDRLDDEVVGLFDVLGHTAEVRNLELRDVSVTGDERVGAVAGRNVGLIEGCTVTGRLSGGSTTGAVVGQNQGTVRGCRSAANAEGAVNVGGLVGHLDGGTVGASAASGAVEGERKVGGLVGGTKGGAIERSVATGAVTATGNAGGLVGTNGGGTVEATRSTGRVTADRRAGGLVGYHERATVARSYATGAVDCDAAGGGLVGQAVGDLHRSDDVTEVRDCYWDKQTSARGSDLVDPTLRAGVGASEAGYGTLTFANVRGLRTDRMQGTACTESMAAFDFEETWRPVTDSPGYPALAWEV